jgi:nucleotide-binding universal stress UspA family protein
LLPFRRILCPLDFSEPSQKALKAAVELAGQFPAELVLLHVIPPTAPGIPADPAFAFAGHENYEEALRIHAKAELTLAAQGLPEGLPSRNVIGTGHAADEIVRLAHEEAVDLIVIATHGLTGWRRLVFGSVAEKVIRHAELPVLVVPAREPNAEGR